MEKLLIADTPKHTIRATSRDLAMRIRVGVSAFVVVFATIISQRVQATPVLFTDRAAFEDAVQPNVQVTFDGPFQFVGGNGNWISDNTLLSVSTGFTIPSFPAGGAFQIFPFNGAQFSLIDGSAIGAFGMDVSTSAASPLIVVAGNFSEPFIDFMVTGAQFIGLLFPSPLLHGLNFDVFFTSEQDALRPLVVDNVTIHSVPEPATSLLLLSGALALSQWRRFVRGRAN